MKKACDAIPMIADLLHRIAFIEKAGTGIRRMRDGARELGYPEPTFAADNFFTALFRPITLTDEKNTPQEPRKYPASTPQVFRKHPASCKNTAILRRI